MIALRMLTISQWINPAKLILNGSEEVEGHAYVESTFISA